MEMETESPWRSSTKSRSGHKKATPTSTSVRPPRRCCTKLILAIQQMYFAQNLSRKRKKRRRRRPWTSLEEARKTGSDSSDSDEEGDTGDELRIQMLETYKFYVVSFLLKKRQHALVSVILLLSIAMCYQIRKEK
ncbi:hypothetical protein VPH35_073865 [Triticum aestivum]